MAFSIPKLKIPSRNTSKLNGPLSFEQKGNIKEGHFILVQPECQYS